MHAMPLVSRRVYIRLFYFQILLLFISAYSTFKSCFRRLCVFTILRWHSVQFFWNFFTLIHNNDLIQSVLLIYRWKRKNYIQIINCKPIWNSVKIDWLRENIIDMCASAHANSKCCANVVLVPLRHNNGERRILKANVSVSSWVKVPFFTWIMRYIK